MVVAGQAQWSLAVVCCSVAIRVQFLQVHYMSPRVGNESQISGLLWWQECTVQPYSFSCKVSLAAVAGWRGIGGLNCSARSRTFFHLFYVLRFLSLFPFRRIAPIFCTDVFGRRAPSRGVPQDQWVLATGWDQAVMITDLINKVPFIK